jgi:hypothetical protein
VRQKLGIITLAVALAITACGGDNGADSIVAGTTDPTEQVATTDTEEAATTDTTEQGATSGPAVEGSDEAPLCSELFAPGQTTDQVLAAIGMDTTENTQTGGECTDEEGSVAIHLLAYGTCTSGARVWYLHPYGYGVAGGTWTPFPEGTITPPADC